MRTPSSLFSSDTCGMVNSALCVVHCLAMPVLLSAGASFLTHPLLELTFIVLAAWAVHSAIGSSTPAYIRVLLWSMWIVFASSLLLEDVHEAFGWIGLGASVGLVVGHVINLRNRIRTTA